MTEEHVTGAVTTVPAQDDASTRIAELETLVNQLQEGMVKRDDALQKMQSEKDKATARADRERVQRERLEAARVKDAQGLSVDQKSDYLKQVAAAEHQRATKFELAHRYGLDPTELDGDYASPEAMRLHAMELTQQRGTATLEDRLAKLTGIVEQLATQQVQQRQTQTDAVQPDAGGRHALHLPAQDDLKVFDEAATQYRQRGQHTLATQTVLAKIHRDPSKVLGSATPSEPLPPELQQKLKRR